MIVQIVPIEKVFKNDYKIQVHSSHKYKLIMCCTYVATCYNIYMYETSVTFKIN
jgi:hypothetical protein